MDDFLDKLILLLRETEHISKEEIKKATNLMRQRHQETSLTLHGPCLICKSEIRYEQPSCVHLSRGDTWLNGLFKKWIEPPIIKKGHRDFVKLNGYSLTTIEPYICPTCRICLGEKIAIFWDQERQIETRQQQKKDKHTHAILMGEVRSTPAKRFWALSDIFMDRDAENLQALSYQEFLSTIYWQIVRNYTLYKRGYACELCNQGDGLNVHHKTYEHHGREHQYLEDLTVLCKDCHAKFHDKVAA